MASALLPPPAIVLIGPGIVFHYLVRWFAFGVSLELLPKVATCRFNYYGRFFLPTSGESLSQKKGLLFAITSELVSWLYAALMHKN